MSCNIPALAVAHASPSSYCLSPLQSHFIVFTGQKCLFHFSQVLAWSPSLSGGNTKSRRAAEREDVQGVEEVRGLTTWWCTLGLSAVPSVSAPPTTATPPRHCVMCDLHACLVFFVWGYTPHPNPSPHHAVMQSPAPPAQTVYCWSQFDPVSQSVSQRRQWCSWMFFFPWGQSQAVTLWIKPKAAFIQLNDFRLHNKWASVRWWPRAGFQAYCRWSLKSFVFPISSALFNFLHWQQLFSAPADIISVETWAILL